MTLVAREMLTPQETSRLPGSGNDVETAGSAPPRHGHLLRSGAPGRGGLQVRLIKPPPPSGHHTLRPPASRWVPGLCLAQPGSGLPCRGPGAPLLGHSGVSTESGPPCRLQPCLSAGHRRPPWPCGRASCPCWPCWASGRPRQPRPLSPSTCAAPTWWRRCTWCAGSVASSTRPRSAARRGTRRVSRCPLPAARGRAEGAFPRGPGAWLSARTLG